MTTNARALTRTRYGTITTTLLAALGVGTSACVDDPKGRGGVGWGGEDPGEAPDEDEEPASPDDVPTSPIYGGTTVPSCGWPTTVSLGGSCSGTLVHPQLVIYAAHCGSSYGSVRLGETISGGSGRTVSTSFCRTFPNGGPGDGNDFAFCKLAQPVNDVPIVPIAMGCETDEIAAGKPVTMVGFGTADNGPYGVKRQVSSSVSSISNAGEVFIGGAGKDTCQGDSGGPVFMQVDDGSWRVFGITSYGGACGGGGYYSQMHNGIAWFESQSGLDLTPCHDADGTWNPGPECGDFPLHPAATHGTWANGCSGDDLSGPSATCGDAYGDGGNDQEPPPPGCASCESYQGALSGKGDRDVQPNGNYYYAAHSGSHAGTLDGPSGVDFDLFLMKWNGNAWVTIASATSSTPDESITYAGTAGYYAWIVESYAGSGTYGLVLDLP